MDSHPKVTTPGSSSRSTCTSDNDKHVRTNRQTTKQEAEALRQQALPTNLHATQKQATSAHKPVTPAASRQQHQDAGAQCLLFVALDKLEPALRPTLLKCLPTMARVSKLAAEGNSDPVRSSSTQVSRLQQRISVTGYSTVLILHYSTRRKRVRTLQGPLRRKEV